MQLTVHSRDTNSARLPSWVKLRTAQRLGSLLDTAKTATFPRTGAVAGGRQLTVADKSVSGKMSGGAELSRRRDNCTVCLGSTRKREFTCWPTIADEAFSWSRN
jgi:hypothetical protein